MPSVKFSHNKRFGLKVNRGCVWIGVWQTNGVAWTISGLCYGIELHFWKPRLWVALFKINGMYRKWRVF